MSSTSLLDNFINDNNFKMREVLDKINPPVIPGSYLRRVFLGQPLEIPLKALLNCKLDQNTDARSQLLQNLITRYHRVEPKSKCASRCIVLTKRVVDFTKGFIKLITRSHFHVEANPSRVNKCEELSLGELILKTDLYLRLELLLGEGRIRERDVPGLIRRIALERFFYYKDLKFKKASPKDISMVNCIDRLSEYPLARYEFDKWNNTIVGMWDLKITLFFQVIFPIVTKSDNKIPSGILLYGPPGCGKTLIAQALANCGRFEFINYSPGSHGSPHINETSIRIQNMFKEAEERFKDQKLKKRTAIFIDEATSVFPRRDQLSSSSMHKFEDVDQFLRNMESCHERGILIICTTNFREKLDPAAIRDGRIDLEFQLSQPSKETRQGLFIAFLKPIKSIKKDINLDRLVDLTPGFPPASIRAVIEDANNMAWMAKEPLDMEYLERAIKKVKKKLNLT